MNKKEEIKKNNGEYFSADKVYFCDDRPSGIKSGIALKDNNLNKYCRFLLERNT